MNKEISTDILTDPKTGKQEANLSFNPIFHDVQLGARGNADQMRQLAGMRGLMISFSKIGPVECTASYELMTEILKEEWGFKGYAVTDIYDDTDIYGAVLASGTTCFDTRGISGFYGATTLENCSTLPLRLTAARSAPSCFPAMRGCRMP